MVIPFVPIDLFYALRSGSHGIPPIALSPRSLGDLLITSGELEACDPFVTLGEGAVIPVPPGRYPVVVTIADVSEKQDGSHLREAYLSVVLQGLDAVSVDVLTSGTGHAVVGVDAGTVGFVDHVAATTGMPDPRTVNWYEEIFESGREDSWFSLMDSKDHLFAGVANIPLPAARNGENLVLSHSGWGDGIYPIVATRAVDGTIVAVHIDLLVATPIPEE